MGDYIYIEEEEVEDELNGRMGTVRRRKMSSFNGGRLKWMNCCSTYLASCAGVQSLTIMSCK